MIMMMTGLWWLGGLSYAGIRALMSKRESRKGFSDLAMQN